MKIDIKKYIPNFIQNLYKKYHRHKYESFIFVDNDISYFEDALILIRSCINTFSDANVTYDISHDSDITSDMFTDFLGSSIIKISITITSVINATNVSATFLFNGKMVATSVDTAPTQYKLYARYGANDSSKNSYSSICKINKKEFNTKLKELLKLCHNKMMSNIKSHLENFKMDKNLNRNINLEKDCK